MQIIFEYKGVGTFEYKTQWSSGADLTAQRHYVLSPGQTEMIRVGLYIKDFTICDDDHYVPEVQIRPRSSVSKKGIMCALGTVDCDYREEIGVILTNLSSEPYYISAGDRIAQLVCGVAYRSPSIAINSQKRMSGFGSTGV